MGRLEGDGDNRKAVIAQDESQAFDMGSDRRAEKRT